MKKKPKIIWISTRFPYPPIGGDLLLTYNHIKGLAEWAEVYLFSLDEYNIYNDKKNKELIKKTGIKDSICYILNKKKSYVKSMKTLMTDIPAQCYYYFEKKAFIELQKLINKINPEIIIFQTIRTFFYFKNINHSYKISFLVDALSRNYYVAKNYVTNKTKFIYKNEMKKVLNVEKYMIEKSKKSIFVSKKDIEWEEKQNININNCFFIPNGVDLEYFKYKGPNFNSYNITFFGNMRTVANNDAALFLIKEIFPKVISAIPDVKVKIVGANPSKNLWKYHNNRNIIVTGKVDDIRKELYDSRIIVSPLRIGAGMQNKILEAAALGLPQVVSDLVYGGLTHFVKDKDLIVSNETAFDKAIIQSFDDRGKLLNLSRNSRKVVEEKYSWKKSFLEMYKLLGENNDG